MLHLALIFLAFVALNLNSEAGNRAICKRWIIVFISASLTIILLSKSLAFFNDDTVRGFIIGLEYYIPALMNLAVARFIMKQKLTYDYDALIWLLAAEGIVYSSVMLERSILSSENIWVIHQPILVILTVIELIILLVNSNEVRDYMVKKYGNKGVYSGVTHIRWVRLLRSGFGKMVTSYYINRHYRKLTKDALVEQRKVA
jgi:hypothetical protein